MHSGKWAALLGLVTLLAVSAFADAPSTETDPKALLEKVFAQYKSMTTYADEGIIVSDMSTGTGLLHEETAFSIKLKKPNQYLISWTQKSGMMGSFFTTQGAVWSDGTQPYLYMGKDCVKQKNDDTALGGGSGISRRATLTIPSLFLPSMKPVMLMHLKNPKVEGIESIGGEECYVLTGSSKSYPQVTFWISKSRFLVLQFRYSLKTPSGGMSLPPITDAEVENYLKDEGQPLTEENKQKARATIKNNEAEIKTVKLDGSSTETHTKITSPDLSTKDFQFTPPPAGNLLKDSLSK